MSSLSSRAVVRLCMVLTVLLLATGCDIRGLFGGADDPPAAEAPESGDDSDPGDPPADEDPAGDEDPADDDGHDHDHEADDTTDGSADPDDSDEGFGDDGDPDMVQVSPDMLIDGSAGSGELRIRESGDPIPSEEGPFPGQGTFRVFCQLSHMNQDDPIVFPGEVGASHAHQFLGNTETNADSTAESIANSGNSTCTGGVADRSAYWTPVIVDGGTDELVAPSFNAIYYQSGFGGVDAESIQPIPEGLMMIAGDPTRTPSDSGNNGRFGFSNARWGCFGGGGAPETQGDGTTIPDCDSNESVTAIINFPQCWDGQNLDSEDHRSHMAYPGGQCPESHPVAIPAIMQMWIFPIDGADTSNWRLASDMYPADQPGGASLHADFVNGWDADIMDRWIDACIRPELDCERSELGSGESLF